MRKVLTKLKILLFAIPLLCVSGPLQGYEVEYVGDYTGFIYANDVFVVGQYAYVADYDSCLMILNISDLSHPIVVAAYGSPGYRAVYVSDHYAFMVRYSYVEIIDVSDPTSPALLWSDTTWERPTAVTVRDNYAYISMFYVWDRSELRIFDVSAPADPVLLGDCDLGRGFVDAIFLSGDYAYIASEREGLVIANISDPYNPVVVGNYWAGYGYYRVGVSAGHAYLPKGNIGLEIVDVSDPSGPSFVSIYDTDGSATDVGVLDDFAYIADGPSGLQIIDVTDPANPVFAAGFETLESANEIFLTGGYIFLMDRYSLLILHFNQQTGIIEESDRLPSSHAVFRNYPNPFNSSTTITFSYYEVDDVSIEVYDITGRLIRELETINKEGGEIKAVWDATDNSGRRVSSGIYFVRVETPQAVETQKILYLR